MGFQERGDGGGESEGTGVEKEAQCLGEGEHFQMRRRGSGVERESGMQGKPRKGEQVEGRERELERERGRGKGREPMERKTRDGVSERERKWEGRPRKTGEGVSPSLCVP